MINNYSLPHFLFCQCNNLLLHLFSFKTPTWTIKIKRVALKPVKSTYIPFLPFLTEGNELLYTVPYQHFTNAIEGFFNILKSRLQKKEGLKYPQLKRNIQSVVNSIESEKLNGLFQGAYDRKEYKSRKTRKQKKKVYISDN